MCVCLCGKRFSGEQIRKSVSLLHTNAEQRQPTESHTVSKREKNKFHVWQFISNALQQLPHKKGKLKLRFSIIIALVVCVRRALVPKCKIAMNFDLHL